MVLLCFLWELASGKTYKSLSSRFGLSEGSEGKYSVVLSRFIIKHLCHHISYQLTPQEVHVQKYLFNSTYGQDDAVGAMDGVFLPLKRPKDNEESHYSGHKKSMECKCWLCLILIVNSCMP